MELEGYGLIIPEGEETPDGYVEMEHGDQYCIALINGNDTRCDVAVHIDGKHIGTWRVNANAEVVIERPVNDDGIFTFYKYGTTEADIADLKKNEMLGLVTAIFKPELLQYIHSYNRIVFPGSERAGGTGLSGKSNQKFKSVEALEYDLDGQVTIHLRLIAAQTIRRIRPISTPVPPLM